MSRWLKCLSLVASGLSAVTSAGLSSDVLAQDGAMTELYGYGVHRFYAGDYAEAQRVLNIVVDAGIEDPRAHYFRGLTQHQLGMLDAAKADFEHAADLEAHGRRAVNVGYALQRIQGPVRQEIEMARMMARVAVYQEMAAKGQLDADQRRVAPTVPMAPADASALPPSISPGPDATVVPPVAPGVAPTVPDAQVNPFQDDQTPVPTVPPTTPPATPPADSTNPFDAGAAPIEPAAPATPAAPADPFGGAAAPSAAEPAPSTPTAPADPFGAAAEPAPAPTEPAPAEPAPAEPSTPAPAAETTNPFDN